MPAGTLSGIGPGDTIADSTSTAAPTPHTVHTAAERYAFGDVIGKGGMGEVAAARDEQIGRQVAVKRLRSATPSGEQIARFLREARIQGRLEHPAVVPVHELWYDATANRASR